MHVIGTAGHVDHGKSSLVRALTGTDPDRWLEERVRGMTLDLGFARLRLDDGLEAGIVDVPGHERFLHNMLAGAAGMELLLLVIAADEGPKPQTHEHLAILQYLNVRQTIVVLTKADLLPPSDLAFAAELVRDALRGSAAEGAPIVPVSNVSGAGLAALKAAIGEALRALPARALDAPAYLPIDRVFALPGHGTIVTGTLMQGRIAVGDRLQLTPLGREVRVRSLQVFGESREAVVGGTRVAANLPGVDTAELARGAVLGSPQLTARSHFAVRFRALAPALSMLRRRTPVRVYLGAAEILGTLVFERVPQAAAECAAELHLRAPTVGIPGATFVVRRLSPKDLLGGGTLGEARAIDVEAGSGASPDSATADPVEAALAAALIAAGPGGATAESAGAGANLRTDLAESILEGLVRDGHALHLAKPAGYVDAELAGALAARILATLQAHEETKPWSFGMTALGLARALGLEERITTRLLAAFVDDGRLAHRAGYFATLTFVPKLSADQRRFFDAVFPAVGAAGNVPVEFPALRDELRSSGIEGLMQAFDMLLAAGTLVKVGEAVYRRSQLVRIRGELEVALGAAGRLTMAEFRDLIGTSRKFAVPLLEWFDASGVTLRSGDYRVLRERTGPTSPS